MSISDSGARATRKTVKTYLWLTLFCAVFSLIYELFSHGVYSGEMILLFFFPLLGGALPAAAIGKIRALPTPGRLPRQLYRSGLLTLAVGDCLAGVLEIYGTTSPYLPVYPAMGAALAAAALLFYLRECLRRPSRAKLRNEPHG